MSNKNLCCRAQPTDYTVYAAPAPQDADTNFGVVLCSTIFLTSMINALHCFLYLYLVLVCSSMLNPKTQVIKRYDSHMNAYFKGLSKRLSHITEGT